MYKVDILTPRNQLYSVAVEDNTLPHLVTLLECSDHVEAYRVEGKTPEEVGSSTEWSKWKTNLDKTIMELVRKAHEETRIFPLPTN